MSIRLRLFGGFFSILVLTGLVAGVGWRSLSGFADGVAISTAAQKLSDRSSQLTLAVKDALTSASDHDRSKVVATLAEVRAAIDALAAVERNETAAREPIMRMTASSDAFERAMTILAAQQARKASLQATHRALLDEFQAAATNIGRIQQSGLGEAVSQLDRSISEQTAFSGLLANIGLTMRTVYEMRLAEPLLTGDPEARDRIARSTTIVNALLRRLASNPEAAEAATTALAQLAIYRDAFAASSTDPARLNELPTISAKLLVDVQKIDGSFINLQSGVQGRVRDARDRIELGTNLLALSGTAITAARAADAQEFELLRANHPAAASAMDAAAAGLFEAAESIYYKIDKASSNTLIEALLPKIKEYRASIPSIVEANGAERDAVSRLTQEVGNLTAVAHAVSDRELAAIDGQRRSALGLLAGGVALAVTLGFAMALLIGASITRPIGQLVTAMRRLAEGKLDLQMPSADRRDEVGLMTRAVLTFKEAALEKIRLEAETDEQRRLAEEARVHAEMLQARVAEQQSFVVGSVASGLEKLSGGDLGFRLGDAFAAEYDKLRHDFNAAVGELQQTMRVVSGTAQGIGTGTGEISQAARDLSHRTEQQAASLEETAAALDEITATVRRTAEGADQARDLVAAAQADAQRSGAVVGETVSAMAAIERSAAEIGQIIGVIDEIAFQTNLLALNAGVEAARAGEAGRGFAVVASEVRALAQRSAQAAKEIKALIRSSSQEVEHGVKLVGETGQALRRIVDEIGQIAGIVTEIAASAAEQANGLAEVNVAVNRMDQTTQQNAAMVEQSTAASQNLASDARELVALIGKFRLDAHLDDAVADTALGEHASTAIHAAKGAGFRSRRGPALALKQPANDEWEPA